MIDQNRDDAKINEAGIVLDLVSAKSIRSPAIDLLSDRLTAALHGERLIYVDVTAPRRVQAERWYIIILSIFAALICLALISVVQTLVAALTIIASVALVQDFLFGGPSLWAITEKSLIKVTTRSISWYPLADVSRIELIKTDGCIRLYHENSFPNGWMRTYPIAMHTMLEELMMNVTEARREAGKPPVALIY